MVCFFLARQAARLLVLTPHKRPHLRPEWGLRLELELVVDRTRARLYSPKP